MSNLTTRAGKGSPLTNNELDANFTNLNADKVEIGGDLSGTSTAPNVAKIQGRAVSADAPENGEKLVWNGTAWEPSVDPTGEPIGHANKAESTVSFNSGTRTFTIAPVSASFTVWCKGVKHTYTSAQTVVIPDTTGLHFIYFNASGVLSTQMSYFTWEEHAPTAYIYWNATTQQAVYFGDERHGITLDWQTHEYLHRTRGAAIASGFGASGYTTTGAGATDADAQIDIGGGTFFDEDLQVDIVSTNTPVAGTWQQDLSGPARIPVLYLSGSAWVVDAPTNFPFKVVSGVPQYNLYSGGSWSTAPVTNNEYFVSWILATHNLTYPVIAVISQAPTNQLSAAEAMTFEGLNLNGFPSVEFRPLYKVIYQYKSGFTNSVKASTIAVYDIRSISAAGVAAALVQDHGNLSGLGDDDHSQYLHVSAVRSPSAAVTNSFLPSQTGNNGKYLTTDGSNPSWGAIPSGSLTFTGDVTGSGNTGSSTTLTLSNSGVTAGTFTKVTVDAKGRVTNGSSASSSDITTALGFTPENVANKAVAGGYASLDGSGKVPSNQLPSYVDDVLEYANLAAFPGTGETGKIYIAIDTVKTYRWSGSAYVEITSSPGSTDAVPEGSTNLYFTNARARAAVSASGSLSYNTSTGIFSYTQPTNVSAFTNDSNYLTGITGAQVTTALGFTPANSTSLANYLPLSGGTLTGSNSPSSPILAINVSGSGAFQRGVRMLNSGMSAGDSLMYAVGNADGARNMGQFYFYFAGAGSTANRISMGLHSVDDVFNIFGSGNIMVGTTADSGHKFNVSGTMNSTGALTQAGNQVLHAGNYTSYAFRAVTAEGGITNPTGGLNGAVQGYASYDGYGAAVPNYPNGQWWVGAFTGGNSSRGFQISGGYSDAEMYFRKGSDGWQAWRRVLTDSNYSDYAPSKTGTGAQGTWNISIAGNAATATSATDSTKLPLSGGNVSGSINLTNRLTGILVNASSQSSDGGSIAIQQVTAEGWTGIFTDYEPYTGWGLWHDNPSNYFCFTAESATNGLRSFTVPSRVSGNRTAYEKVRIEQGSGDVRVGGSVYITTSGHLALHAGNSSDYQSRSIKAVRTANVNFNSLNTGQDTFVAGTNYIPNGGAYNQPADGDHHYLSWGGIEGQNVWGAQIDINFYDDRMWFRRQSGADWQAWRNVLHDSNYGSYAVALSNDQTISGIKTFSTQIRANSIMGQEQWEGTITVAGDANTYYPVTWWGGDQDAVTEIEIFRYYAATAPWNPIGTGVHQGALTLKFACNFGGWGGANYDIRVDHFRETYTTMVAEISRFGNERGFCVWLRGGTATYQIRVKGRNYGPTISYSAYDPGGNGSGVSPRTDLPRANLKNHFSGGTLYSGGSAVVTAANYNSYSPSLSGTGAQGTWGISISGSAASVGGRSVGNSTDNIAYLNGSRNLFITNPETYSGEVRLGAAWGRGGLYGSNNVTVSTSGSVIDHVHSDIVTMRHLYDSESSRLVVGRNMLSTPYTLIDGNQRPGVYIRGSYPFLTLDGTATSNGSHGPTIQFTHDGAGARQWVVGTNGTGTRIDFGYSDSGSGNSNYNPHNGISGYGGTTWMTVRNNGRIGLGWAGDWGDYGTVGEPSYPFHFVAGMENGHSYLFRNTGGSNGAGAIFVNNSGGHSWGIVSELRIDGTSGSDRPSLLFSTGYNSDTWSVGFGFYGDSNFRIRYDHGHRNGGWGTTALEIDRGKRTFIHQGALYQSNDWVGAFQSTPTSSRTFHGDVAAGGPTGTWWFYDSMRHSNGSNYWGTQIAYGWEDNANNIYQRNVTGNSWSGWVRYLNSNNYSSYALPLGGGTVTGQATFSKTDDHAISVGTIRGRAVGSRTGEYIHLYERVHIGSPNGWGAVDAPSNGLSTYGSIHVSTSNGTGNGIILADDGDIVDLNDAYCSMRFSYGVRVFSANRGGSAVHTLHSNGNFTAAGNVTAYSDETLKKDWAEIQGGYVEKLANLKCGTYTRIDSGFRQAGVSAQGMREILQEVVGEDDKGILSLAYGNAAMVSAVELAKELVMLKKELAELKSRLH